MKFLRGFQLAIAPGVSVAGVLSILPLSPFTFNIARSGTDVEIPTNRRHGLLMKWKRSSKCLMVGWISPANQLNEIG
jgi:hypothetical protein